MIAAIIEGVKAEWEEPRRDQRDGHDHKYSINYVSNGFVINLWHEAFGVQKEWAKNWVRALISGRYPQTAYCLRDGKGYDPIGVLADISGLGYYSDLPIEAGEESSPRVFLLYDTSANVPPTILGQLQQLTALEFTSIGAIAAMNDKGMSFKHVAGYIARNWERL
jgi:hypothetical protein